MTEQAGAVIGINLGHSYGSIACINQHGRADVIANEDGERQIATRIAFNGDQVYIGNQATAQLIRNAPNVIDRFVNLLGRPYSQLTDDEKARPSAPVIDQNGSPAFQVSIDGTATVLTAHDVAVRFLRSLFLTAKDFLSGVPIAGAVLSVPQWYDEAQIAALRAAATEAGLIVLQTIPAPAAALAAYGLTVPQGPGKLPAHPDGVEAAPYPAGKELDRNVVVLDMGGSSTDVTVLAARAGLYAPLASVHDATVGGAALDQALIAFFAKEFTKKSKLTIAEGDKRAWAKLRNEAEVTKRALSASNSAQCSVESLAEGVDFTGSVNRMRFDMLAGAAYGRVVATVERALQQAGLDACQIDEVVLAGGSARLTGLADRLAGLFGFDADDAAEEGARRTQLTGSIDADQVVARGCAVQAQLLAATPSDSPEGQYLAALPFQPAASIDSLRTRTTAKPLGLVLPAPTGASSKAYEKHAVDGTLFVPLVAAFSPLPVRRSFRFGLASGAESVALTLSEGEESVRVDTVSHDAAAADEDDEDDEPLEPEEVRTAVVAPRKGGTVLELLVPLQARGSKRLELEVVVDRSGTVSVVAREEGEAKPAATAEAKASV